MTPAEAADRLNGNEYGNEGSSELFAEMKATGLVAVFGYSDDNMELRGAVDDEVGCWDGGKAYLTSAGLLENECDDDDCPYFAKAKQSAAIIEALWNVEEGFSWTYRTAIPHSTFVIREDDEAYCRGIVFALADVPVQP